MMPPSPNTRPIWLLGASSILGWNLSRMWPAATPICNTHIRHPRCRDWMRLNMDDEDALRRSLERDCPALVVHGAGICDVPQCEANPEWANRVNVEGTASLLKHLPVDCRLIYLSSDHVFGAPQGPCWEDSPTSPISVYGQSRVTAEALVSERPNSLIIRPGLPIGASLDGRTGHLDWLRYRSTRGLPITIVKDEGRSAAWVRPMAARVIALAHSDIVGVRHFATTRCVSRLELAEHLRSRLRLTATFQVEQRKEQGHPHIGHIELATRHEDPLAIPLPSAVAP